MVPAKTMRNFLALVIFLTLFVAGDSLVCYECKYERTLADCQANGVTTCTGHEDACFREEAEIGRRNGPRVVSAGCGRSWRSADACDFHNGKLRCTAWCTNDKCNGKKVRLDKIDDSDSDISLASSSQFHLLLSIISPLLLAYVLYFH